MENWQLNISLIPSIAVILTSANRMALGLTEEINVRLSSNLEAYKSILPSKMKQLKRLSIAITFMYLSLTLLVINALLSSFELVQKPYHMALVIGAIILFLVAIILKVQFSYFAVKIRQKQFAHFLKILEDSK